MARRPTLAHRAEYLAIRGAVGALRAMSWERATGLGASLAHLAYSPFRIRRTVVERQIAFAFPELAPGEVSRLARASYGHIGRTAIEANLVPYQKDGFVLDLFDEISGWEILESALAQERGVLIVSGHIGNWELAGSYLAARGLNFGAVVRRMGNPLFDEYLNRNRMRLGMKVVYDSEAVRLTPRLLRAGGALALLADQGVRGLASTYVPFFGRPAKTPKGPAVLAIRLGAPLLFALALRKPNGKFRFVFEKLEVAKTGDRDRDVDAMVALYTATLEDWVRKAPDQYFWMHRRWRRQPPGTPHIEDDEI